ncbi:hypothetical protein BX661DRAFT_2389 [Kickxella alabastrina]|uniref:uncharacterized protein n=1 Tax=Kickxella alabastrina TaxID=61397 RepID=UPI0022211C5B|nr:uncharacterized protein BX661DRAFT_2389 [Kickxella alabastrina]KAI7834619.1 hypothetical protein BX661DRAFT_2389 [Kickxella alabastrina]
MQIKVRAKISSAFTNLGGGGRVCAATAANAATACLPATYSSLSKHANKCIHPVRSCVCAYIRFWACLVFSFLDFPPAPQSPLSSSLFFSPSSVIPWAFHPPPTFFCPILFNSLPPKFPFWLLSSTVVSCFSFSFLYLFFSSLHTALSPCLYLSTCLFIHFYFHSFTHITALLPTSPPTTHNPDQQ